MLHLNVSPASSFEHYAYILDNTRGSDIIEVEGWVILLVMDNSCVLEENGVESWTLESRLLIWFFP
jgi:hypothetical protein